MIITALQITSAQGFSVDYYDTYKVVSNHIANETYVLYQCETPAPSANLFPNGTKFFKIPLVSISAPETVPFAFLELLGVTDRVYDVSSYVVSPCGQKLLECNRTAPNALDLGNTSLLEATVGPYVDGVLTTGAHPFPASFAFSAAQDPGDLNRAEWVKFLGLFFNLEKYASNIFAAISTAYNNTEAQAQSALQKAGNKQPVVAWTNHYVYETNESYQLSFAPYKEQLAAAAGGTSLDFASISKVPGVRTASYSNSILEFAWDGPGVFASKQEAEAAFLTALSGADVLIDETYAVDPTTYNLDAFKGQYGLNTTRPPVNLSTLKWLNNNAIFREDGLISVDGGLDWFEGAIARPDKVLSDIVRAVQVGAALPNAMSQKYTWIRSINEAPTVVGPSACTATSCNAIPSPICPFVSFCSSSGTSVILNQTLQNGQCVYESCPKSVNSANPPTDAAQMAAPAVILLTVLIVFVEALIHFC